MPRATRRPTAQQNPMAPAPTGMPPIDAATPRSARGHAEPGMPWTGCDLVPADPNNPKMLPANSTLGLKLDLIGWPKMGSVAAYTCKSPAPIDVLKNIDHTPDNLHRMYGAAKIQVQAWTLSETGGLLKPIQAKVWTFEACEFDDPDMDTDPEEPEDDVGTERWTIGASALQADQRLRAELTRRNEVRKYLADEGGYDDEDDDDDDRGPRGRGGRPSARGGSGNRREWGRERPGARPMPRRGGAGDVPEEFYNPDAVLPLPAPGMEWGWDDRAGHHRQFPKGTVPMAAPVVPVVPEKTPFFETPVGAALLGTIVTAGGAIVQKMMEPKPAGPDPLAAFATLMAAMTGQKGDPERLKQLEIEAEEKRARLALEAQNAATERENNRIEAARLAADAQRAHDAAMERQRAETAERIARESREAAAREAIAADDRARQRAKEDQERIIALKQSGLITEGPTEAQRKAEMELAMLKLRVEMAEKSPKTPDMMEMFEKTKATLAKFGVKMGEGAPETSLADMMDTPAAKALAENLAPAIGSILMKFAGATAPAPAPIVAPAPNIHIPDPLALHQAIQKEAAEREQRAREFGQQEGFAHAQQQLAAQAAGAPVDPPPAEAPPMPAWQAVEQPAPVEQAPAAAPPEAPAAPAAEPAEATPVETPAEPPPAAPAPEQAPEAPPVDATPTETPAATEAAVETAPPPVERHPVIDRPETEAAA